MIAATSCGTSTSGVRRRPSLPAAIAAYVLRAFAQIRDHDLDRRDTDYAPRVSTYSSG